MEQLDIEIHDQAPKGEMHNVNINAYYDSPAILLFEQMAQQQIHLGYWDERYPDVTMAQAAQRLTQVVVDQIDIPRDGYYLDIGCGCGQPAMSIVEQKNCYLEGVTINPQQKAKAEALAVSKGLAARAGFCVGDASDLPYAEQQFDGALLFESIHHIGHAEALSEAWRVMKSGASILIADGVVLKDKVAEADKAKLSETFVAKTLLTESQIRAELYQAGFEELEVLDLSSAILPTWAKLKHTTAQNRAEIVAENGQEFFDMLIEFWQQMKLVWSANARYLIVKARKP